MFRRNKSSAEKPLIVEYDPRVVLPFQEDTKPAKFEQLAAANQYRVVGEVIRNTEPTTEEEKFQLLLTRKIDAFVVLGTKVYDQAIGMLDPSLADEMKAQFPRSVPHQLGRINGIDISIGANSSVPGLSLDIVLEHGKNSVTLHPTEGTDLKGNRVTGMTAEFSSRDDTQRTMMVWGSAGPDSVESRAYGGATGLRRLGDSIYVFAEANEQLSAFDELLHTVPEDKLAVDGLNTALHPR
jgi:hypothetical protein